MTQIASAPARFAPAGGITLSLDSDGAPVGTRLSDGSFLAVWSRDRTDAEGQEIVARRFDETGSPSGEILVVVTHDRETQVRELVQGTEGGLRLLFEREVDDRYGFSTYDLGAISLTADGAPLNASRITLGEDRIDIVALVGGGFAEAGATVRLVSVDGTVTELEAGSGIWPDLTALADGGFLSLYRGSYVPNTNELSEPDGAFLQRFAADGEALTPQSTFVPDQSPFDSVPRDDYATAALATGGFAVARADARDLLRDDSTRLILKRYNDDGTEGPTIGIAAGEEYSPRIQMAGLPDGGVLLAYSIDRAGGTERYGLRRFDPEWEQIGPAVPVAAPISSLDMAEGPAREAAGAVRSWTRTGDGWQLQIRDLVVNDLPEGDLRVPGAVAVGTGLALDDGMADPDGIPAGARHYQWLRDGAEIAGATGPNYTPVRADAGAALQVRLVYTDAGGALETVFSDPRIVAVTGGAGAERLEGGARDDRLFGFGGDDALFGYSGDDLLNGGAGADVMNGGPGSDTYYLDDPGDRIFERAGDPGEDRVFTRFDCDLNALSLEHATLLGEAGVSVRGSRADNRILGNEGDNWLFGLGGRDTLEGGDGDDLLDGGLYEDTLRGEAGADTLLGGAGADLLIGGPGGDEIHVDDAGDRVIESRNWDGVDSVVSTVDFRMGRAHVENLQLLGEAVLGAGNGLRNELRGNAMDNVLDGGRNNDTMIGGAGNDTYHVRAPGDTVIEARGRGLADTIKAYGAQALPDNVERLYLQTMRNAAGEGVSGVNGVGNDLDNTIVGNPFDNVIIGREGSDVLKGQAGADTFVFDRDLGPGNVDRIIDFNTNEAGEGDRLKLKASLFGDLAPGALDPGALAYGTAAAQADDRLVFDQGLGRLWFDADGAGGATQELVATFDQGAVVTAADVVLF